MVKGNIYYIPLYTISGTMSTTMRIKPNAVWSDPDVNGLTVSDTAWCLDIDRYQNFIQASTGVFPDESLSRSDCYRIGNRLQALIEERKRSNEWEPDIIEAYPEVESLDTILWLARFFRACHESRDPGEPCCEGSYATESCIPAE